MRTPVSCYCRAQCPLWVESRHPGTGSSGQRRIWGFSASNGPAILEKWQISTISVNGAPDRIRTCGLCLRRAALYPAELRVRGSARLALGGLSGKPGQGMREAPRAGGGVPTRRPCRHGPPEMSSRRPVGALAAGVIRSLDAVQLSSGTEIASVMRLLADQPFALARKVRAEQILDQLACGREGQGLAFVRPVLQHDETPRLRASSVRAWRKPANFDTVRAGSSDQKAACSTSIGRAFSEAAAWRA